MCVYSVLAHVYTHAGIYTYAHTHVHSSHSMTAVATIICRCRQDTYLLTIGLERGGRALHFYGCWNLQIRISPPIIWGLRPTSKIPPNGSKSCGPGGHGFHRSVQALAHDGLLQSGLLDSDRIPFTGGGNRTHVAVPKNLLTTEALYHSATEVLIEFDKYFGSRVV